jgi:hypothetical protein
MTVGRGLGVERRGNDGELEGQMEVR